jgi:hypothetical protein
MWSTAKILPVLALAVSCLAVPIPKQPDITVEAAPVSDIITRSAPIIAAPVENSVYTVARAAPPVEDVVGNSLGVVN